ncbi:MAG TPA: ABC transporter permease [Bryobacteraceae bacterium]|nr:ABC transporter permease [Bryobacteraceae bacterium]
MFGKDLVYAARALRKSPVFLITATLTIALGIGASTAIFSVTNAILLRPLPYRDPDRLVVAGGDMRTRTTYDVPLSVENYTDFANGTKAAFEDMAAVSTFRNIVLRDDGTPEQVKMAGVTTNFFRMMGATIAVGRDFIDQDGLPQPAPNPAAAAGAPAPPPVRNIAILSHEYWQRRFGSNTAILGQPLGSAPNSPIVVGVLAPGFELFFQPSIQIEKKPDIWFAQRLNYDNRNRNQYFLRPVGRLKAGVSLDRAVEAGEIASADIRKNFPIYGTGNFHFRLVPMHQYLVSQVRPAILALMGAVTFLLLIACANVANLLLVRTSLRVRELAVRAALGASRARLIGQMLAEALLLAAGGTILGLGLADLGIRVLIAISPTNLPRLDQVKIDPQVLTFSILAGLLAAAIFGLAPAFRASRPDVIEVLRGSGRTAALGGGGLRNIVAVAEVALSFVLLIGSGLMVRSFIALQHIDPGYDSRNLLTFQVLDAGGRRKPEERAAFIRQIQTRLQAIGGAESVTGAGPFPLTGGFSTIRWGKEDALSDPSKYQSVDPQVVLPGYFETMRTPLLAGRTFTDADSAPDRTLAIVDQFMAAKAFPNQSAIGKRILVRIRGAEPEWVEIVGVVAHQRVTTLAEFGREQIYFTDGYLGHGFLNRWAIRTAGDPNRLASAVRTEIYKLNPRLLIDEMQPMSVWVEEAQAGTRFSLQLIGTFAAIAALLASVGLYGVLATFVRQRTAEIGVRMAMGAAPSQIFSMVVGQGLRLSAIGIVFGLIAAAGVTRVIGTLLVGVKPTDPLTFAAIAVFFFVIATIACWIPAWRASSLDPTVALRD